MDFSGKTAIASGAASGMGFAFAKAFCEAGGNTVMCDVNREALDASVAEINEMGKGKALGVLCDVRDYRQVENACQTAWDAFGSLDIVCNFAGGTAVRVLGARGKYAEFPDVPIEVFDWGLDVNLKGQFYFCHAASKMMREQKSGLIVNIGSISGMEGDGYGAEYPTAKSGVMFGLTKSVAQFGAKYGIRCVCVSPGPVLTRPDMAGMQTLSGRAAEPREIVDLILFIASDKGQFINGENIMIDGGRNAMHRCY
ncbi:MAG: SDR family oxidoreductase [Clostridia bacterium]|nr:SDR family oxidoreductase [Clostridia bacterium]